MAHSFGNTDTEDGVTGTSGTGRGVVGLSTDQAGVVGFSEKFVGVWGDTKAPNQPGVFGRSVDWQGVHGESTNQAGVVGVSEKFVGVWGDSKNPDQPGIFGRGAKLAGRFDGDVELMKGDIRLLGGNDCAEIVDCAEGVPITPGSVTVLDADGQVRECDRPYDRSVAGVVSGAGNFRPGLVLGKPRGEGTTVLLSLVGRAYCRVDADYAPIQIGDLITTSPTRGHGMAARDPQRSFGAVIGKALRPLDAGRGLIPILIALQ